jgi:hypothetical protein
MRRTGSGWACQWIRGKNSDTQQRTGRCAADVDLRRHLRRFEDRAEKGDPASNVPQRSVASIAVGAVLLTLGGLLLVVSSVVAIPLFGNPTFMLTYPAEATSLALNLLARFAVLLAGLAIIFHPKRADFVSVLALCIAILAAATDVFLYYSLQPSVRSSRLNSLVGSLAALGVFVVLLTASFVLNRKRSTPPAQLAPGA